MDKFEKGRNIDDIIEEDNLEASEKNIVKFQIKEIVKKIVKVLVTSSLKDELAEDYQNEGQLGKAFEILFRILTVPLLNYLASGAIYYVGSKRDYFYVYVFLHFGTLFLIKNIIDVNNEQKQKKNSET